MGRKKDLEVVKKYYSEKEDVDCASKGAIAKILNGEHVSKGKQKLINAGFESV